jgi:hypothetical protein
MYLIILFLISSVPLTVSKCTSDEITIWKNNFEFTSKILQWAKSDAGVGQVAAYNIRHEYGVSAPCADCHRKVIGCGTLHCWRTCIYHGSSSDQCVLCSNNHCRDNFLACVGGASVSDLPLPPNWKPSSPVVEAVRIPSPPIVEEEEQYVGEAAGRPPGPSQQVPATKEPSAPKVTLLHRVVNYLAIGRFSDSESEEGQDSGDEHVDQSDDEEEADGLIEGTREEEKFMSDVIEEGVGGSVFDGGEEDDVLEGTTTRRCSMSASQFLERHGIVRPEGHDGDKLNPSEKNILVMSVMLARPRLDTEEQPLLEDDEDWDACGDFDDGDNDEWLYVGDDGVMKGTVGDEGVMKTTVEPSTNLADEEVTGDDPNLLL